MSQRFDAIVISGGGSRGVLILGVLHYYYDKKLVKKEELKEFAGTSIGSVICLLLNCGYTPFEIFSEIYNMQDFFTMKDCQNVWQIFENVGLMSMDGFVEKIENLVLVKLGIIPTFAELREITGKSLYISGTNVTKMIEEKYCYKTHPDMSCVEAVKLSCNLPFIFQRIKHDDCFVVDGGLLNNCPWDYITSDCEKILNVVISTTSSSFPDDKIIGYFYRLIMLPISQITEMRCQMAPEKVVTVLAEWEGSSFLQFTLTPEQKMKMFLAGFRASERKESTILLKVDGWK